MSAIHNRTTDTCIHVDSHTSTHVMPMAKTVLMCPQIKSLLKSCWFLRLKTEWMWPNKALLKPVQGRPAKGPRESPPGPQAARPAPAWPEATPRKEPPNVPTAPLPAPCGWPEARSTHSPPCTGTRGGRLNVGSRCRGRERPPTRGQRPALSSHRTRAGGPPPPLCAVETESQGLAVMRSGGTLDPGSGDQEGARTGES